MTKYIVVIVFLIFNYSEILQAQDKNNNSAEKLIEIPGSVKINICSRGCYQYYIAYQSESCVKYLYPDSIPQNLKKDNLKIQFSGTITNDSTELLKPDLTDKPVKFKKIGNIHITDIKAIKNE